MVIAIIGILSSIVLVNLGGARTKAQNSANMEALSSINIAVQGYYANHGSYPDPQSLDDVQWDGYCGSKNIGPNMIPDLVSDGYGQLPVDVRHSSNCAQQFIYLSNGSDYKLLSHLAVSMDVPSNLIDPERPTFGLNSWAWGYWTPGAVNW